MGGRENIPTPLPHCKASMAVSEDPGWVRSLERECWLTHLGLAEGTASLQTSGFHLSNGMTGTCPAESQTAWDSRSETWVGTFSLDQCDDPDGRLQVENSSVMNYPLKMLSPNRTR